MDTHEQDPTKKLVDAISVFKKASDDILRTNGVRLMVQNIPGTLAHRMSKTISIPMPSSDELSIPTQIANQISFFLRDTQHMPPASTAADEKSDQLRVKISHMTGWFIRRAEGQPQQDMPTIQYPREQIPALHEASETIQGVLAHQNLTQKVSRDRFEQLRKEANLG
jgi:hypothetical protein